MADAGGATEKAAGVGGARERRGTMPEADLAIGLTVLSRRSLSSSRDPLNGPATRRTTHLDDTSSGPP